MPTEAVVLAAPVHRVGPRVVERREDLAGKAVVADRLHRPLDAAFVAGMADAGGIDVKPAGLRVPRNASVRCG